MLYSEAKSNIRSINWRGWGKIELCSISIHIILVLLYLYSIRRFKTYRHQQINSNFHLHCIGVT